jgi:protein-S-isoprenylcysteine O-methyltransferase Ste14
MVSTNRLFATVGHGTLAPWNPPQRLVVRGIYRHVRNPMMLGVCSILFGEALFTASLPLLCWFTFFVIVVMIVIPLVEEPGLVRRFGEDYVVYRQNVPRWIPRRTPWDQGSVVTSSRRQS